MVQARQFRKQHIDCHYASGLYRYLREFSIAYHDYSTLVSMDDKHVVKIGEPGYPVSGLERGKQVLVSPATHFTVGDHDFTKISLVPSVIFMVNIPESMGGTLYHGKVLVGLKDSTFQSLSSIRHARELKGLQSSGDTNPIVLLYTDGGLDHHSIYPSVQIHM